VCDGDVLEGDVEFLGTLEEIGADSVADCFTLCDEFCGIELRYDGFEDFISDGGENTLVIVLAEILHLLSFWDNSDVLNIKTNLVNLGQSLDLWSMQHPER